MTLKQPKISIITPSFNQGKYIKQTIDSVLDQNYANLEYIIIDGGSTDNTLTVLKEYSGRIKWISEKDNGQMDALNKGLGMATGEIIAFINSDDYYLPHTLDRVINFFRNNPESLILTGDYVIVNEFGNEIQSFIIGWKKLLRKFHSYNIFCIANYINQPSTFWKNKLVDKVGYFNEDLHYVFDYEYWLRIFKANIQIDIIGDKLSGYRIHNQSKGGMQYKERAAEELRVQRKYNKNLFIYILHYIHNRIMILTYNYIQ